MSVVLLMSKLWSRFDAVPKILLLFINPGRRRPIGCSWRHEVQIWDINLVDKSNIPKKPLLPAENARGKE